LLLAELFVSLIVDVFAFRVRLASEELFHGLVPVISHVPEPMSSVLAMLPFIDTPVAVTLPATVHVPARNIMLDRVEKASAKLTVPSALMLVTPAGHCSPAIMMLTLLPLPI
jgi:hypothetical protein